MPDDDVLADRYLIADEILGKRRPDLVRGLELGGWPQPRECRHNLLYWTGGDWWGVGPGAHSHAGGTRWWNVRHPAAYAQRITAGISPGQAREILTDSERATERVMLATRLAAGCPLHRPRHQPGSRPPPRRWRTAWPAVPPSTTGTVRLTQRGRLLADAVIRGLTS